MAQRNPFVQQRECLSIGWEGSTVSSVAPASLGAGSRPRSTGILLLLGILFSFSSLPSTRRLFWTVLSSPVSTEKRKPKEAKSPKPTVSERAAGPRRLAAFGVVIQTITRFAFAITVHRISTHGTPVERTSGVTFVPRSVPYGVSIVED